MAPSSTKTDGVRPRSEPEWHSVAAPAADLPAALRGTVGPERVLQALQDLERIKTRHAGWMRDVHVDLVRRLNRDAASGQAPEPFDESLWYRGAHLDVLRDNPLVERIGSGLTTLTVAAADLAASADANGQLPTDAFARCLDIAVEISAGLQQLIGDTWNLLASIDPLTGLGNRPAMLRRLAIESDRHARENQPCCVAMLDLDHFKAVNDTHGHVVGDTVLRSVASLLAASVRPYDAVFRYGGEEFLLCLPNADLRTAWAIAERLRLKVASWSIPIAKGAGLRTSVSIGIAPLSSAQSVEATLERADAALYAAKSRGRNCVVVRNA